jgi:hypothetical protein
MRSMGEYEKPGRPIGSAPAADRGPDRLPGHAFGIGIREDDGLITRETSRFVPHLFRKAPSAKPPIMSPNRRATPDDGSGSPRAANDPLWDPWFDR